LDLVSPRLYLPVATFQAQPNDYDLSSYTNAQLQDLLVRASGVVDSYLRKTYLATEITERLEGDGSNRIHLGRYPIIYVRSIQFVLPGMAGFGVPISQLLVDIDKFGEIINYTPLIFQGLGEVTIFPRGVPVDICYAYGYGYALPAPAFTMTDVALPGNTSLPLGPNGWLAVTTRTMWGETTATPVQHNVTTGAVRATIVPVMGAYKYEVYFGTGATQPAPSAMNLVAESPATTFGDNPLSVVVAQNVAPPNLFPATLPTTDSSSHPIRNELVEATRLVALGMLWEQNSLANRGVQRQRSGDKDLTWRSTEGNSGKGVSYVTAQVQEVLKGLSLQAIF
jgi:hypothetical protein